jgi:hypothetical protein
MFGRDARGKGPYAQAFTGSGLTGQMHGEPVAGDLIVIGKRQGRLPFLHPFHLVYFETTGVEFDSAASNEGGQVEGIDGLDPVFKKIDVDVEVVELNGQRPEILSPVFE